MDTEHWQRVDNIFQAVLEMDPAEIDSFLDRSCSGDESLRRDVQSLLDNDKPDQIVIDTPAFEMVACLLGGGSQELSVGQFFGQYRILELLGVGGMGEVYLAHDTVLERRVALKLLPSEFNEDDDRTRRFQQEARAASALNHPNILTVYQIGQIDNRRFIATEYIEGKTLRQVIRESTLDFNMAVDLATQIASALTAAHQAAIVHRDIKPENIILRPDGYAKVLDFGLAKPTDDEPANDDENQSKEQLETRPGMVLGTVKYMSPEQARGLKIDGRSDIFSLGVVLFEAVTGKAPFEGTTTSDLIASILREDTPRLSKYIANVPAELERIVVKTLDKAREERYQSAGDLLRDLKALNQDLQLGSNIQRLTQLGSGGLPPATKVRSLNQQRVRAAILAVAAVAGVTLAGYGIYALLGLTRSTQFQNINMTRVTTSGLAWGAAISPDGRYVAYVDTDGGKRGLWIKALETSSKVLIESTGDILDRATFSPDGNYLYFPTRMQGDERSGLYQVPVLGGTPRKIINVIGGPVAVSPDGSRLAFVRSGAKQSMVVLVNADGSNERRLAVTESPVEFGAIAWSPDGKSLAAVRRGQAVDGPYGEVAQIDVESGNQSPITDRKWITVGEVVWLSDGSGLLITATGKTQDSELVWRVSYPDGDARLVTSDLSNYSGLSIAKDSTAIVSSQKIANYNLYVWASDEGRVTRITSGSATWDGWSGVGWTPDGRIIYSSTAAVHADIWSMLPDGSDQKQLTFGLGSYRRGLSVSPDGRFVVFISNKSGRPHVWRVDVDGSNARELTSGAGELNPFFAPDGVSVIYSENVDPPVWWKIPIDGGEPVRLTGPLSRVVGRGISPDGNLVAYRPDDWKRGDMKMAIASLVDGKFLRILNVPRLLEWTPDGRGLTYLDRNPANLWLQPVDGAEARPLTNFTEKEFRINTFGWSRDGKYLAFCRGIEPSDIVLIKSVN